jgi:ABC-type molybdate transport system substrate-binding protein
MKQSTLFIILNIVTICWCAAANSSHGAAATINVLCAAGAGWSLYSFMRQAAFEE